MESADVAGVHERNGRGGDGEVRHEHKVVEQQVNARERERVKEKAADEHRQPEGVLVAVVEIFKTRKHINAPAQTRPPEFPTAAGRVPDGL